MANTIYIPSLNPIQYTEINPSNLSQYMSRHMDKFQFVDTIQAWEQKVKFLQPWSKSDSIRQQMQSNYAPINLKLIDCDEAVYYDNNFSQQQQNANDPTMYIYQHDLDLSVYGERIYFIKLTIGTPTALTLISEPIYVSAAPKNTLLLEYKNATYYQDTIFENGYSPSIRIPGTLRLKTFGSKDTIYEDQSLNNTLLDAKPFRLWELNIGTSEGVPDYLADKMNRVLGCGTLLIDGRKYSKADGASMEEKTEDNYPMRGWTIELREALNRNSKIFENENLLAGQVAVVANVDSKGFGPDDNGGSIYQIKDIN